MGLGAPPTAAQEEVLEEGIIVVGADLEVIGYPTAIHQGTCDTLVAEPAFDLGTVDPITTGDQEEEGLGEDEEGLAEDEEGLAEEDEGLAEDEGLGEDDAAVEGEEVDVPVFWTLETEIEDVSIDDLIEAPHSVVVHRGDIAAGDYLACGEIGGDRLGNELPVAVLPIGNSAFTGVAIFEEGEEGFLFGGDTGGVALYMYQLQPLEPMPGQA